MRFFSGSRDKNFKKGIASTMYKKSLNAGDARPETQDEKYRKILNTKIDQIQQELAHEKKRTFKLPGTVTEEKEVSPHALEWMKVLAEKKMQKEMKKQKAKQKAYEREKREEKRAIEYKKKAEAAAKQQALNYENNQRLEREQQAASQKSYFFGYTNE